MLLTPRYDGPSLLRFDVGLGDPAVPLLRQRRRLASRLTRLDDEQWATASRCEQWSVRDVVAHLVTTNHFWVFSIAAAIGGTPTRLLSTFDPVTTPAELVDAMRSQPTADVLAGFLETNEALAGVVAGLDDDGWALLGEAPPGHVPLRAVALHALWDSWIHERDIVLPLGLVPVDEPDEIAGSLAYSAALGSALALAGGTARPGAIAIDAENPDLQLVVEVDDSVVVRSGAAPDGALGLAGPAVELVEALSLRGPFPCPVADDHRWLISGLAAAFDRNL